MKKWTKYLLLIIPVILMGSCSSFKPENTLNKATFKNPPRSSAVHTWWHWMDGAITKEGITRDLESMQRQGIGQATILNVGLFDYRNMGVPQVAFASDEWYGMFEWAVQEADRLGITLGAHNCDGWSTSGGPWITPEASMKQYVWSTTYVNGGATVDTQLSQPVALHDYYRDQAVVAFPAPYPESAFRKANPTIMLNDYTDAALLADGCPVSGVNFKTGDEITVETERPCTVQRIALHLRRPFGWDDASLATTRFSLSVSLDGITWRDLDPIVVEQLNQTQIVDVALVTATHYKLKMEGKSNYSTENNLSLTELELLNANEMPAYTPGIPGHMAKTVSVKPVNLANMDKMADANNTRSVESDAVIDLTAMMDANGRLQWEAPEGNWKIIRFGYTTTGVTNAPSTPAGKGLECDKMDKSALELHFESFPKKLIEHAGVLAGRSFKFLLIDSWECNYQNWTAAFAHEFEKQQGYSIVDYIPVLCGETVASPEISEAFLYDFRSTIADLIETNYYRHFSELCHEYDIQCHAEVIYGNINYPPLDIVKSNSYPDMPMDEFWAYEWMVGGPEDQLRYVPSLHAGFKFQEAASLMYDKPVIGAEAYTGFAHYSEAPAALKPFGDRAFCSGINQMILHSYVHQPFEKKPGMTLGQYASHFNRHNPWWTQASTWLDYHERLQYLLQQGHTHFDVLYYVGDQLPQDVNNDMIAGLPQGYNAVTCNLDVLTNQVSVHENGNLVTPSGQEFSMLVLPKNHAVSINTLLRLEQLVAQGATIYGEKPQRMLSLVGVTNNQKAFDDLVSLLWGEDDGETENHYSQGRVLWGRDLVGALQYSNVLPDFTTDSKEELQPHFIHRVSGDADVYFVANQYNRPLNAEFKFHVTGKNPEIWDPITGETKAPAVYRMDGEYTSLPVTLGPYGSRAFVFTPGELKNQVVQIKAGDRVFYPSVNKSVGLPDGCFTDEGIEWTSKTFSRVSVTFADGSVKAIELSAPGVADVAFTGSLSFAPWYDVEIDPVAITSLNTLDQFASKDIQYFAGMATYMVNFDAPSGFAKADEVWLDLGQVTNTSTVVLNGDTLGIAWVSNPTFKVADLKPSGNELSVTVACNYRNRIIGDLRQYGELRTIWTSAPFKMFLNAESDLQPTGWAGPLRLIKESRVVM